MDFIPFVPEAIGGDKSGVSDFLWKRSVGRIDLLLGVIPRAFGELTHLAGDKWDFR